MDKRRTKVVLWVIFGIALVLRLLWLQKTTYVGYDEARDILTMREIYQKGDLKLMGPPASGDIGLFHGPLYWYLLGPIYSLFGYDHLYISILFRIINAAGVFLIFYIADKLFSNKVALLSAFIYSLSFEQNQYAMYTGKESLALICWLVIVASVIRLNLERHSGYELAIVGFSFACMIQFNIIYAAYIVPIAGMFWIVRKKLRKIDVKSWLLASLAFGALLSTFLVNELKYNFRSFKTTINLVSHGFGVMGPGQSKYSLFIDKYWVMFRDNFLGINLESGQKWLVVVLAISLGGWVIFKAIKQWQFQLLAVWMFGWVGLMMMGGHMAYYTNMGISVAEIIAVSYLLINSRKWVWFGIIALIVVSASNLYLIYKQRNMGLITGFKPQPFMNLQDEKMVINKMYKKAGGEQFTVRLTGIPYRVQTVWAYLLEQYGYEKYGYYPLWEHGNVLGYLGQLPAPNNGTTCLRFLLREPMRGLPVSIVELDHNTEDLFSDVISREEIGQFVLETRRAWGECY